MRYKFRAYDHINKVMEYNVNVNQGKPVKQGYQWFNTENTVHDSELMQFTGLHDKNGKEIYEGDIVEERWNNPLAGGVNVDRYKVETEETSLIKMTHSSGQQQWDRYLWMRCEYVEVIGNIYENPELLKEEVK